MSVGVVVACVIAYLLGSVPVAVLVARRKGVDIRSSGDKNPGWWNAKTTIGATNARAVLVGDVAKGAIAVGVAWLITAEATEQFWPIGLGVTACAMVGHAWPVFAHFRGGRSILTFVGGFVVAIPLAGAAALATLALLKGVGMSFARASVAACLSAIVWAALVQGWRAGAATALTQSIIGLRFWQASRQHTSDPSTTAGA